MTTACFVAITLCRIIHPLLPTHAHYDNPFSHDKSQVTTKWTWTRQTFRIILLIGFYYGDTRISPFDRASF